MRSVLRLVVVGIILGGLLRSAAVGEPRMYVVGLNDDPSLPEYNSGTTVITAAPGERVCVGFYVQGDSDPFDVLALNLRFLSANATPTGLGVPTGSVVADCTTMDIDNDRGDFVGFTKAHIGSVGLCALPPFEALYVLFAGEFPFLRELPAAPGGVYFGELCYDVSSDACGDFVFTYSGAPDTKSIIVNEFGEAVLDAVFDPLVISVGGVCCTTGLPANDPTTISECGASPDSCLMSFCSDDPIAGLGCLFLDTDPINPTINTDDLLCGDGDLCTRNECVDSQCVDSEPGFGDIDGNGTLNVFDIFCIVDGFSGDFSRCSMAHCDINGSCGSGPPCCPNGILNIFDMLTVLDAFGGEDPCCGG